MPGPLMSSMPWIGGDVWMAQCGEHARFAFEARAAVQHPESASGGGRTFSATSRCRRRLRARYTSPIPPTPRSRVISNPEA